MIKLLTLFLLSLSMPFLQAKTVYIVPFGGHDIHKLFYDPNGGRDEVTKPFCSLREALELAGYTVKFTWGGEGIDPDDFAGVISLTECKGDLLDSISSYPREKCILLVFEPPVVLPHIYDKSLTNFFGKIYVMQENLPDNVNYFKLHYPQPRLERIENIPNFSQKKFCALIACNKDSYYPNSLYQERRNVLSYYAAAHPGELDLYGLGWEGYTDWKGTVPHKWEVMKNYKFCYCYENMGNQEGYITEKIFDCLVSGSVPIYLGATNITDYIPKECFIDRRDFSSDEELYVFLKAMDEETYLNYMEAIKNYLKSPRAQLFSIDTFVETLVNAITEPDQ